MAEQQEIPLAQASAASDAGLFQRLEEYPWATDEEFQSGLTAILGPNPQSLDASRIRDLTLHARCFYFSRKYNANVPFEDYRTWRKSQNESSLSDTVLQPKATNASSLLASEPALEDPSTATKSLSFAEVMELVQSGQPIPGIKDIPDTVLEGKGTEAAKPERQKPWETANKSGPRLFDRSDV